MCFVLATNDLQNLPLKIFRAFLTNASRDACVVVVDVGVPAVGQPTLAERSLVGAASGIGDTDVPFAGRRGQEVDQVVPVTTLLSWLFDSVFHG